MGRSLSSLSPAPAPTVAPAPPQAAALDLDALSTAVVDAFWDRYGFEPSGVRSLHFEEHVITILQDGPTPLEHDEMAPDLVRAAERALGRRVLSHRSSLHPEAQISFEIFLLAGEDW